MQRNREKQRVGKTKDLFKKTGNIKGTFHTRMGMIKDRTGRDLTEQKRLRRGGKNTQNNYTQKILMTQVTTTALSLTQSQTSWSMKSSGPQKALLQTKLVEVMEFQLSYLKILKDDVVQVLHSVSILLLNFRYAGQT